MTSSTHDKLHLFRSAAERDMLQEHIFRAALDHGFELQAWAIFSNHYHLVGFAAEGTRPFVKTLHGRSARELNLGQASPGRMVWYRTWDTLLTYEKSYLARLNYVQQNPVRHGIVARATDYPWSSARWFENHAPTAFYNTVCSFAIDRVNVVDDFDVELETG